MRLPRVVIAVAFFTTTILLTYLSLRASQPPQSLEVTADASAPRLQSFFSIRAPFSLFPPNAIITLTHENSTAFLARPAAFGPLLPTAGLKGQVWIGSGFGDDPGAEGELGCSDVPGWVDSYAKPVVATPEGGSGETKAAPVSAKIPKRNSQKDVDRTAAREPLPEKKSSPSSPSAEDGTDDHLHHPLPGSALSNPTDPHAPASKDKHADIQSIQEGAEITGKVVLLSRGGCGFLEKVKWAQRRGAAALIVGDDTRGGELIQMYARGDTSNVTIPSVFTSRTTAHLLSSLMSSGSFLEDAIVEGASTKFKTPHTDKGQKDNKQNSLPTFTTSTLPSKPTSVTHPPARTLQKKAPSPNRAPSAPMTTQRPGWFKSLFSGARVGSSSGSSRPPSSGRLDWVLVDDWKDDDVPQKKKKVQIGATRPFKDVEGKTTATKGNGDDFVIGVQDWRDPDLVGLKADESHGKIPEKGFDKIVATKTKNLVPKPTKTGKKHTGGALQEIPEYVPPLRGGSITPGSGEYGGRVSVDEDRSRSREDLEAATSDSKSKGGLLTAIFGDDEEDVELLPPAKRPSNKAKSKDSDDDEYEGLWVTLTPTSGASPFLDTLLVLVVSPLVTLTVVYALLLVRSRIRRRRWRAPKSVVERLPVRTYQTIATPGSQSPRLPSPTSSSATAPLLQRSPTRPRPRSRTSTGIPEPGILARVNSQPTLDAEIPPRPEQEKNNQESPKWKKYTGKQVECVVCLEEYIDGVSRVMSLPCGHEFHVDCITPWLTTRRRTCPICKGDVVRSLARGSPSARHEPYHDESDDDDVQARAATSINQSAASALPIPGTLDVPGDSDLERGSFRRAVRLGSWRSLLAGSLGSSSRSSTPQQDRDR